LQDNIGLSAARPMARPSKCLYPATLSLIIFSQAFGKCHRPDDARTASMLSIAGSPSTQKAERFSTSAIEIGTSVMRITPNQGGLS
jgi:hypothetical protein